MLDTFSIVLRSSRALAIVLLAVLAAGCNSAFGIREGTPRCTDPMLIDDMEDGVSDICPTDGRYGKWFTFGDGTSTDLHPSGGDDFKPALIDGGRDGSRYAAHYSGSGFTDWGAGMGFTFTDKNLAAKPYDASTTNGIRFWMKSNVPVFVMFPIPETTSPIFGGACSAGASGNCDNHFSFLITAPSSNWTQYEVPYAALRQNYGDATFNPRLLIGIYFGVHGDAPFDVWVDDVSFYHCSTTQCAPTCTDPAFPISCFATAQLLAGCYPPGTDCNTPTGCRDPNMIDDMEDGNPQICESDGRKGFWYAVGDSTSTNLTMNAPDGLEPTLIEGTRNGSRYAQHFAGSGFKDWGALMAVTFANDKAKAYDASGVAGIKFWMKNDVPVRVGFRVPEILAPGGVSTCADPQSPSCGHAFMFTIAAPNPSWTEVEIPFSALPERDGSAVWTPRLFDLQFFVDKGPAFDVWVDDISFYNCSNCLPFCNDPERPIPCPANSRHWADCYPEGTDCTELTNQCRDATMIDDLEDGDTKICETDGRSGYWYAFNDGTSAFEPNPFVPSAIPGGRPTSSGTSKYAARIGVAGVAKWGAIMAFAFDGGYDASRFGGIKFSMKSNVPVSVGIAIPSTTPAANSGNCADTATTWNCNNGFSVFLPPPPNPDDWKDYNVPFSSLFQGVEGDMTYGNTLGGSATWNESDLRGITFWPVAPQGSSFETWIDDVQFYSCYGADCLPTCDEAAGDVACPATADLPAACWPEGTDCSHLIYASLTRIWGSGPEDVWAVGSRLTGTSGVMRHWKGSSWVDEVGDKSATLHGVWGSSSSEAWAVGDFGQFARWNGSKWSLSETAFARGPLVDVWGNGSSDVWAIESPRAIWHSDGTSWKLATSAPDIDGLLDLSGSAPDNIWASGTGGKLLRRDGTGWTTVSTATDATLVGVWTSGPNDVWAVGTNKVNDLFGSIVLHWDGSDWSPQYDRRGSAFSSVWGSGPDDVWVVGTDYTDYSSLILHWDGSQWRIDTAPRPYGLNSVWGSSGTDVWAVGPLGVIRRQGDGDWKLVPGANAY